MKLLPITALLVAGCSPAYAQDNCLTTSELYSEMFIRFGEERITLGLSEKGHIVEIWGNEETGSWTAIVTHPEGFSCIVDQGGQFVRSPKKGKTL